jgi:hypothetical protein
MELLQNRNKIDHESIKSLEHETHMKKMGTMHQPGPPPGQKDDGYFSDGGSSYCSDASDIAELRERAYVIQMQEKSVAFIALQRACDRTGVPKTPHISHTSDVMAIRAECDRVENEVSVRRSIKFQRRILLTVSSGVEYLHNKSPILKGRLSGWGECMLDSIDEYDTVFRRLHEKHGPKIANGRPSREMEPEMELLYMVAYNAFTFTVSQSIANLTTTFPQGTTSPTEAAAIVHDRMEDAKSDSDRLRRSTMDTTTVDHKPKTTTTKKGERVIQFS